MEFFFSFSFFPQKEFFQLFSSLFALRKHSLSTRVLSFPSPPSAPTSAPRGYLGLVCRALGVFEAFNAGSSSRVEERGETTFCFFPLSLPPPPRFSLTFTPCSSLAAMEFDGADHGSEVRDRSERGGGEREGGRKKMRVS